MGFSSFVGGFPAPAWKRELYSCNKRVLVFQKLYNFYIIRKMNSSQNFINLVDLEAELPPQGRFDYFFENARLEEPEEESYHADDQKAQPSVKFIIPKSVFEVYTLNN